MIYIFEVSAPNVQFTVIFRLSLYFRTVELVLVIRVFDKRLIEYVISTSEEEEVEN